jgi:hypothetical protein
VAADWGVGEREEGRRIGELGFHPGLLYVVKESNIFCDADEKLFVRLHLGPVIACPQMS